jgi:hypothetical protein
MLPTSERYVHDTSPPPSRRETSDGSGTKYETIEFAPLKRRLSLEATDFFAI